MSASNWSSGAGDENAAHGLRRRTEKVRAVLPGLTRRIHELEPCFVNERSGLERVTGGFARHFVRSQAAEFVVNGRQKFFGSLHVAPFDAVQDAGDVAHGGSLYYRSITTNMISSLGSIR